MSNPARPAYQRGIGRCIFCGRVGNLSKEHIFGDWLKEHFPRDATTTHTAAHISWPKGIISDTPIDLRRTRQGHSGTNKLRVVCRDCNNGWLSCLENWAKKALPPLIIGRRSNLVPAGQTKLATWAIKTSMVAANFKPRETSIPQSDRTNLMNTLVPPKGWFVWACAYKGGVWSPLTIFQDRGALSPTPVPDDDSAPYYVQATTFGLGQILFCVLSSSSPSINDIFTGVEPDGGFQIWPQVHSRSILWPPANIFGDNEAYGMANILRMPGVFDHSFDRAANWAFTF